MRHLLFRLIRLASLSVIIACIFATLALAQAGRVEVTRNVNLRHDPSTQNDPIILLRPPEKLELLETNKTDGYYHVRTDEDEEGWVWAKNVRLITPDSSTLIDTPGAIANQISSAWAKGTPNKTTFNGIEGPCPYNGNGFDPDQYMLKNRTDIPGSYHDVTWAAIRNLPFPGKDDLANHAAKHRKDWSQEQLDIIRPFEGIPVRVVGYVVAIRQQDGNQEGTNCKFHKVGDVDTHVALVENFGDGEGDALVVEWTPRFLNSHPKWKNTKLEPWRDSERPVRISGWLMVDPDHWDMIGDYRGTIWEIHPITRIEVWKDGAFVDLDSLP